jgi:hypothetical protein
VKSFEIFLSLLATIPDPRRAEGKLSTGSGFPCSVFAKCDQKAKLGKMASRCDHFIEM